MAYATLMIALQVGQSNKNLLKVAGRLAQRLNAGVVGITACRPMDVIYSDGYVPADILQQNRDDLETGIKAAEAEFHTALNGQVNLLEWRSTIMFGSLSDYVAQEARSADLLVTSADPSTASLHPAERIGVTNLLMQAGRPILVVPPSVETLDLQQVIVGWKDTRETRRAVSDALPLLQAATRVTVLEIAPKDEVRSAMARLQDVLDWLGRHNIEAGSIVSSSGGDDAERFRDIVQEQSADLVVAGAYGHSRVREWALGGVTRDLLLRGDVCTLLSH